MFSIIIVDDNLSDREGVRDLIDWNHLGIQVVGMAANGVEGYEKAKQLKPDFILTDVAMPLMDGLKMAEKIKDELPRIKFIFMSCFDDFNFVKDAMKVDAYGYVLKPIDLDELTQTVKKIKNISQSERDMDREQEILKQQLKESMPVLREQFLQDLLYGYVISEQDIEARMNYLGMDYFNHFYTIVFIQIDNYDSVFADTEIEQKYLMIHSVKKILEETLVQNRGYVLNQQHNSIAVIIFDKSTSQEDALNNTIECLNNFKEQVNNILRTSITIGIAEFLKNLTRVPRLYERAEYAVKSKFYSQGNRIILASEVKGLNTSFEYNLITLKEEIRTILENGHKEQARAFIDKYYKTSEQYPESYIKSFTFTVINILQNLLAEMNESFKSIFDSDTVVWEKLSRFETIVDIKQWLINIIESVRTFSESQDSSRYKKIVEDIKNIIEQNYSEFENIEQIVKPLYISASHANLIFKQQTGKTIFDYLIQARMEAAKRMLADPYVKIYEIAEKVGYKSKSYFGSVFKEYTGMTPKQYADKYIR